jgi:PAS domain S-box-containing protein
VPAGPVDIRRALDAMPQLGWMASPDGTLEYLNRRAAEYAGLAVDDLLGWDWGWVVHPDDLPGTLAAWTRSVQTGAPHEVEFRLRRHDGRFRWFLTRAEPTRDADGRVTRWFGTCTDIDDRKRAEFALRATAGLFRAFVERSDLGFALLTPDRTVTYASPGAGRLLGRPPGAVVGTPARLWVHPDDLDALGRVLDEASDRPGEAVKLAARVRQPEGTYLAVRGWAANLLPDPDVRAVAVTFWDAAGPSPAGG